jgi:single-stranded DNA-binding protein
MKKIFDAVATIGKYKDRQGNEKKRYVNVGSVFQDDQGRMSLKLEAMPVGPEWSGWLAFYEPKQQDGIQTQQRPPQAQARPAPAALPDDDDGDDIPF